MLAIGTERIGYLNVTSRNTTASQQGSLLTAGGIGASGARNCSQGDNQRDAYAPSPPHAATSLQWSHRDLRLTELLLGHADIRL